MKKSYVSPVIYAERFVANEYIAACDEYRMEFQGCDGSEWNFTVNSIPEGQNWTTATLVPSKPVDGTPNPSRVNIFPDGVGGWIIDGSLYDEYHCNGDGIVDGCYQIDYWQNAGRNECKEETHKYAPDYPTSSPHHHFSLTATHNVS